MIFFPPLYAACFAAKPPRAAAPFRFKLHTTVRAHLFGTLTITTPLLLLLSLIRPTASIAAKAPQPASLAGLFHHLATLRAVPDDAAIIAFRVIVL